MNFYDFSLNSALNPSQPFLKWAGGKRRLLPTLLPLLPSGNRLVEPFVGGGSVFLASQYRSFLLGDANQDLVDLYVTVRDDLASLVARVQKLFVEKHLSSDAYLEHRSAFNASLDTLEKAALFVFLNRFGFNGLCRYNRNGQYNVPYGHLAKLPSAPIAQLVTSSSKLQAAEIRCGDFLDVMKTAREGDVVYCDPPYLDLGQAKSFSNYVPSGFSLAQHVELVEIARFLASKGVPVVISNHDSLQSRELYRHANLHSVQVRRSISAQAASRGSAAELIAVFS
jgi:DNA adenine methylase